MVARRRRKLAAARKAAGYTQEGLADAVHVDRSTVQRWEAGEHAPWPYLWPKLARVLGLSRAQLQVLFTDNDPQTSTGNSPVGQEVVSQDMKRRTLMKWSVAATAASFSASAGTSVGLSDVKRLQSAAARLHSLDQQHGGVTLWRAALAQAHDGLELLEHGTYTDSVGRQLLTATGQLQICAGWLAFDAGQHEVARGCFTDALAMSRQSSDAQVETRALANLALQSNALGRPREAQRYANGAAHAADAHPSVWLAAIPQLRMAISGSLTGDARATDAALSQARRVLDRDNTTEPEEWLSFLSPYEIDAIEAVCCLELHRPRQAARLLERAVTGYPADCARNRALYRIDLARARLDMGEVDGALESGHAALDDLSREVASSRALKELTPVAQRIAQYPAAEKAQHFLARFHALSQ